VGTASRFREEVRAYVGAFFSAGEKIACGALGLLASFIATYVPNPEVRALLAGLAIVAFFIGGFLVWRDEYRKTTETPEVTKERDQIFAESIRALKGPGEVSFLRRMVLDGSMPASILSMKTLADRCPFAIESGGYYRPNPTYKRRLEEWASNTVDPKPGYWERGPF
jgi:hypothetical protein